MFYADAIDTDLKNLDFNDQLLAFRSDLFAELPKQLFIVDTCANYAVGMRANPPRIEASKGKQLPSHEQFALFAARPGDFAKNIDAEETGLYTWELLAELEQIPSDGTWPPDMEAIVSRLQRKFVDLRARGLTKQTPVYLWNRDWIGNERFFGQMPVTPPPTGATPPPVTLPRRLTPQELASLRNSFVACASLRDFDRRSAIVNNLRYAIHIKRSRDISIDVLKYSGRVAITREA